MWPYIVTFISSLAVAWIAIRWSARSKDKGILNSLAREISTNISICELTCQHLEEEIKLTDEHKMGIRPFPELFTRSWNMTASTMPVSKSDAFGEIEAAYHSIDVVNISIRRIEELKHGLPVMFNGAREIRKMNYTELKRYIEEYTLPALKDAKQVVDKELPKYKWWLLW